MKISSYNVNQHFMFCHNCGTKNDSNAGFCKSCGAQSKAALAGTKHIPFHRIVYAGGRVWLNDEYRTKRLTLYQKEGIEIDGRGYIIDFDQIRF